MPDVPPMKCDVDRNTDAIYSMIAHENMGELSQYMRGLSNLVEEGGPYVSIKWLVDELRRKDPDVILCRATFYTALCIEPSFLQFVMDLPNVSAPLLCNFKHTILGELVDKLLKGFYTMDVFVDKCTIGYITM